MIETEAGSSLSEHFADGIAADDLVLMLRERFRRGVRAVQPVACAVLSGRWRSAAERVLSCWTHAIKAGADAFITGEMSYHEYFGHEQEIQICVIGHYQSEQFTGEIFRSIIQENFPDAKCCISEINTNPILYL